MDIFFYFKTFIHIEISIPLKGRIAFRHKATPNHRILSDRIFNYTTKTVESLQISNCRDTVEALATSSLQNNKRSVKNSHRLAICFRFGR